MGDSPVQHHAADENADAILRRRVAELTDASEADVLVGRACPRCGSSRHGRPWARVPGRGDEVSVSLSRAGPHLVTAVTTEGAVGVDIESVAAVDAGWDPGLVLHPDEAGLDAGPAQRAALWCGKEARTERLRTACQQSPWSRSDLGAPGGALLTAPSPGASTLLS
ncbi:hypothetical protein [Brachybacterium sp. GCM10030252]|uniref:hypothetical protein n=1 Tax=Brachybacterium sp. GCM10030252 TaxID=3273380 RepID=UPI00361914C2